MRHIFTKLSWWALLLLAGSLFVACSNNNAILSLVEPASDRPTFVWIFSDP